MWPTGYGGGLENHFSLGAWVRIVPLRFYLALFLGIKLPARNQKLFLTT